MIFKQSGKNSSQDIKLQCIRFFTSSHFSTPNLFYNIHFGASNQTQMSGSESLSIR